MIRAGIDAFIAGITTICMNIPGDDSFMDGDLCGLPDRIVHEY